MIINVRISVVWAHKIRSGTYSRTHKQPQSIGGSKGTTRKFNGNDIILCVMKGQDTYNIGNRNLPTSPTDGIATDSKFTVLPLTETPGEALIHENYPSLGVILYYKSYHTAFRDKRTPHYRYTFAILPLLIEIREGHFPYTPIPEYIKKTKR